MRSSKWDKVAKASHDHSARAYWDEHREEVLAEQRSRLTVTCPASGCSALVERIERYHVSVVWELEEQPASVRGLGWTLGAFDSGTHFHLFCAQGHETKRLGRQLPKRLQRVVYPGDAPAGGDAASP